MIYLLNVERDDNDTWLITCPALPEVTTFAERDDDIDRYGIAALEEAIAGRMAAGQDIPAGRPPVARRTRRVHMVALPLATSLKVELYRIMREEKVTRADLMRRLSWNRESVDRLFRLDHASRTDQLERAYQAINKKIDIRISAEG